ncbi:MFS transporter [Pelagicoccus enzymogenes]|uniref:MFS transporter n=1 Tax=Pelagicoccus enzymogenes TaxID=2773457 RepID=UPI0028104B52|nr:MFS transporter [Pelagicoccus enzymogenes]MDQ8198940.1 MFS transporter [Pelagicoccus enzymogenes]
MSTPNSSGESTYRKTGPLLFLAFSSMWTGLVVTEYVSNNVLSWEIKKFTENAFIISFLLSLNPAFGFIANPIIGIISDRIWTPVGRRAFFLIVGAPIVATCLILIPHAQSLIFLVLLIFIYQIVQDILWGSDHPLLADLVSPEMRTKMVGTMNTCSQLAGFFFLRYAMDGGENFFGTKLPFYIAAAAQVLMVAAVAIYIGRLERPAPKTNRPKLTFKRYVHDAFAEPTRRRYLTMVFSASFALSVVQGFASLYAVETLFLSRSEFGQAWSYFSLIPIFFAFAAGWAVERFLPKPIALAIAFAVMACGSILGYFAGSQHALSIVAIVVSAGTVVFQVTYKAFYTEFLPKDIIGQLSGVLNICYALGRLMAYWIAGGIIFLLGNDYSYIWPISAVASLVSIIIVLRIPDPRFLARKQATSIASD